MRQDICIGGSSTTDSVVAIASYNTTCPCAQSYCGYKCAVVCERDHLVSIHTLSIHAFSSVVSGPMIKYIRHSKYIICSMDFQIHFTHAL